MKKEDLYAELFQFHPKTYYSWKKQEIPVIMMVDKYFSEKDLVEFLELGKISKYDKANDFSELKSYSITQQKSKFEDFIYAYQDSFIPVITSNVIHRFEYVNDNYDEKFCLFWKEYYSLSDASFQLFFDDLKKTNFSLYLNNLHLYVNHDILYNFFNKLKNILHP